MYVKMQSSHEIWHPQVRESDRTCNISKPIYQVRAALRFLAGQFRQDSLCSLSSHSRVEEARTACWLHPLETHGFLSPRILSKEQASFLIVCWLLETSVQKRGS